MIKIKTFPVQQIDPARLTRSRFNPNEVDPINLEKLRTSVERLGFFDSIKVRELEDGSLEILGGEHRAKIAIALGMDSVPCTMLGRIDDKTAHEIMLADNHRYGQDDPEKLSLLIDEIGDLGELVSLLPLDESEMAGFFGQDMGDDALGELDGFDSDSDKITDVLPKNAPTHKILRFKIAIEDADRIGDLLFKIQTEQGFTDSDQLTNAGDALTWLLTNLKKS